MTPMLLGIEFHSLWDEEAKRIPVLHLARYPLVHLGGMNRVTWEK